MSALYYGSIALGSFILYEFDKRAGRVVTDSTLLGQCFLCLFIPLMQYEAWYTLFWFDGNRLHDPSHVMDLSTDAWPLYVWTWTHLLAFVLSFWRREAGKGLLDFMHFFPVLVYAAVRPTTFPLSLVKASMCMDFVALGITVLRCTRVRWPKAVLLIWFAVRVYMYSYFALQSAIDFIIFGAALGAQVYAGLLRVEKVK